MIINFSEYKLFENPNDLYYGDKYLEFDDIDARPFAFYIDFKNEINITSTKKPGKIHDDILDPYEGYFFKGRIWLNSKIISFWQYPKSKEELKKFVELLEKYFNINIWNDPEYKIELSEKEHNGKIIRISDYDTNIEDNIEKSHIKSPLKKPLKKPNRVPYGFGSKNPKNKSLKYKQILYQENLNEKVGENDIFSIFLRRYDVSKAWYLIQKNPEKYLDENGDFYKLELEDLSKYFPKQIDKNKIKLGISINKEYALNLTDDELEEPGIFILDDGLNFLIDGWHRGYAKWKRGDKDMRIWVIEDKNDIKQIRIY